MRPSATLAAALLLWAAHANAATYVVTIDKMAFGVPPQHLTVGDTIQWRNADIFRHTVTATSKEFDLDLAPKAQGSTTLSHAGTIEVYCRFHPTMKVTLVVGKAGDGNSR
jgi:plastocyanin